MSRVILKYRNIAQGKMKSIYLEFNPAIHDIKGNSVRYECLNLEIYTNPENSQQLKHNRAVEEIAETIRCERYLQLVRHDYSFLAKARLDVSVSAMQPFFYHYACYLCCNIIKTSKIC